MSGSKIYYIMKSFFFQLGRFYELVCLESVDRVNEVGGLV